MEAVKKYWFWGIFISILTVFAMSYNANAIDFVIDYDNYDIKSSWNLSQVNCEYNDNTTTTAYACRFNNSAYQVLGLTFNQPTFNAKAGDIITFDIVSYSSSLFTMGETPSGEYYGNLIVNNFVSNDVDILSIEPKVIYSDSELINLYYDIRIHDVGTSQYFTGIPDISTLKSHISIYRVFFRVNRDINNYTLKFNDVNSTYPIMEILPPGYNTPNLYIRFFRFKVYERVESKENKEVEEKTQGAVDESEVAGGSSSTDAQSGTTGLLTAISGAVNVISSASPTNCKINGNMGNLDIGQLDLCANPAPSFIQTIGSLILILMCVPLAISLFNRFITLFRSFQS